jgi:hypothetical protein
MTDLELFTCVAIVVVVVCGLAAYVWTVLTSSKDDYSVPPVFHGPNANRGPAQGSRTRVAAPPAGDVDRAGRNPSGANLSLFGNPYQAKSSRYASGPTSWSPRLRIDPAPQSRCASALAKL